MFTPFFSEIFSFLPFLVNLMPTPFEPDAPCGSKSSFAQQTAARRTSVVFSGRGTGSP
jgi:hypothetical protein